jgi:hypothetical protein
LEIRKSGDRTCVSPTNMVFVSNCSIGIHGKIMNDSQLSYSQLPLDVVPLKKSVTRLFDHLNQLMKDISNDMGAEEKTDIGKQAEKYQSVFNNSRDKVENEQLVMAIVAPLKAGKTTIINTIIGQEILPTRRSAMTALPTRIIFTAGESEPRLLLTKSIIEKLKNYIKKIEKFLKGIENDSTLKGHFESLLNQDLLEGIYKRVPNSQEDKNLAYILNSNKEKEEFQGKENILNILRDLNDLIRIFNKINEEINNYHNKFKSSSDTYKENGDDEEYEFSEIPCIYTPFFNKEIKQKINSGSLVIVDTPGKDEEGEHNFETVVRRAMNTSSMVLLVLDFSKPDNKIERQIAEEVKGFIEVRGSEHLYILQNKWDDNKDGIKIEKLQAEFARKYDIDNATLKNRMFAVSALYAFTAISFQQAPKDKNNPEFQEAAKGLLKLLNPTKKSQNDVIQRMVENANIEELENQSQELWEESRFTKFLENVIDSLIQEVVPRSMLSELKYSYNCLTAFQQYIDAKLKFYKERLINNGEKLKTNIENMTKLQNDLENDKNNFLEEITTTYSIVEITVCIQGLQSKVKDMKETTPSCFQLRPNTDSFTQHKDKILNFETNDKLTGISDCNVDELYKCLLCKLNDEKIKSFEFPEETDANENNEKIKDVIADMLNGLIDVIGKILNKKLIEQDTKFREDLKKIEEDYLESAKKIVFENNDTQENFYKIPELEAYKDDPKNQDKALDIINIKSFEYTRIKRFINWLERHVLRKDIPELTDSHKIPMKEYFIQMYIFMIKELNEWNERINNDLKNVYYGECKTRLKLVENKLQELKSSMEKAEKEENAAEVIKKLEDLKSSKESEIKRMKDEIKKHKQYTEQALPSRIAR